MRNQPPTPAQPAPSRLQAMMRQRCPRCLRGQVFRGIVAMYERCPVCGLRFGRESGYFVGAMYFSYAMSAPLLGAIVFLLWWRVVPHWPILLTILLGTLLLLPFVVPIFRYSRVLWMHLDWVVDPGPPGPDL